MGEAQLADEIEELLGDAPAGERTVLLKVHKEATAMRFEPVIEAVSEAGGDLVHVLEEVKKPVTLNATRNWRRPYAAVADLKQLKENGSASAAEMAEFLAQLRGRRPQEVLGIVAGNGLTRGIVVASAWTLALMAVFTAGPYFWPKLFPAEKKAVAQEAPPAAKPAVAAEQIEQPSAPVATPAVPAPGTPSCRARTCWTSWASDEAKASRPQEQSAGKQGGRPAQGPRIAAFIERY